MRIEVYIHQKEGLELDLLKHIIKLLKMSKLEFDALREEINTSLVNLADDITRLTDRLVTGGMTAEEEEAVLSEFREVGARIKLMADRTNGNV